MSRFTISAIIGIVGLVVSACSEILQLISVIRDLIDNGKIDGSSEPSPIEEKFNKYSSQIQDMIGDLQTMSNHYRNAE